MNHERTHDRIQKDANNDSHEIIELNEPEPIVFKQTRKEQQELHNQNNRRIMLVIHKTIVGNSNEYSHGRFK
jgi:hypothetical protein